MSKEKESHSLVFSAEISILHSMLDWVRKQIMDKGLDLAEIRKIEIALEEAFVNIIHYAYLDQKGDIEVTCNFSPHEFLELQLKDYGKPFNPLEEERPFNRFSPLEEREEGGLGIPLIQGLMDKIDYQRQGVANILTLTKYCS